MTTKEKKKKNKKGKETLQLEPPAGHSWSSVKHEKQKVCMLLVVFKRFFLTVS